MKYFERFSKIYYDAYGTDIPTIDVVTNITARVKIRDSIKNNTLVYYTYDVKDGESPEIIAAKYYNDPNRHWIILLANNIINPWYQWPLSTTDFGNYIIKKYGSLSSAMTTVDHWIKTVTRLDSASGNITVDTYIIDETTYDSLPTSVVQSYNLVDGSTVQVTTETAAVSQFDTEWASNESRRTIVLIDKRHISQIEQEFKNLFTHG